MIDLVGMTFQRLTVISRSSDYNRPNGKRERRWVCACQCGNEVVVVEYNLKNGHTQSCGCLQRERAAEASIQRNRYDLTGEYGIGYCTNTGAEFYFDLSDYDLIKDYCWSERVTASGYHRVTAYISNEKRYRPLHHLIFEPGADHIDRNPMNNRRSNLRRATQAENSCNAGVYKNNTSGVTGVSWSKKTQKWRVYITKDGKTYRFGSFKSFDDAVKMRLQKEKELFGEFAPQQHLYVQYGIEVN